MKDSIFSKSLLVLGVMFMAINAFGQGRGDGTGNGQGGSREHMGKSGQKTEYTNVNSLEVFSASGIKVYPTKKEGGGLSNDNDKIRLLEINPKGLRVYFTSRKGAKERVIDLKCDDCIIVIDHLPQPGRIGK